MHAVFKTSEQCQLLIKKGVYPYTYIDSAEKLTENCLPPIESFHNNLNDTPLNPADYVHGQKVWKACNITSLGDYHNLYLLTDVLLLADIFEDFRSSLFDKYGLDATHFFSLAHFSWN